MAYYFLTASKDATVYLQQPNQNTGLDEILEVSKIYYGNLKDISRPLIKFNLNNLSQSISDGSIKLTSAKLLLKETESQEIPLDYIIYAYPISQSWEMGNGTRFDDISSKGVTWNFREGDGEIDWIQTNLASGSESNPNSGAGGTWYTASIVSQSFSYQSADINMSVKTIVQQWLSGSIPNEGFILKYSSSLENDTNDYGQLKFFSKETHTIHQPKLVVAWDDQTISTGSLTPLDITSDFVIIVDNLSKYYKKDSNCKIRIRGREKYPLKTFANSFSYNDVKYLPIDTYYQIKDYHSNDIIIPFGVYSKVSCDSKGNYINFNFSNWQPNRIYKIEFKINLNGANYFYDDNITFEIVDN